MTDGSGTQNRCAHTDWFVWRAGDRPPPSFSLIGWLLTKMKNPTGGTKRPGHHSIFVSGPSTHLPDFCNARPTQRVTKNAPPVHPKNDERVNASLCQRVPRRSGAPRESMPRMHVERTCIALWMRLDTADSPGRRSLLRSDGVMPHTLRTSRLASNSPPVERQHDRAPHRVENDARDLNQSRAAFPLGLSALLAASRRCR